MGLKRLPNMIGYDNFEKKIKLYFITNYSRFSVTRTRFTRGIGQLEYKEKSLQNTYHFNIHMYGITRASNGPKSANSIDYFLYCHVCVVLCRSQSSWGVVYMFRPFVFALKCVAKHYIVNTAALNMYQYTNQSIIHQIIRGPTAPPKSNCNQQGAGRQGFLYVAYDVCGTYIREIYIYTWTVYYGAVGTVFARSP